MARCKAPECPVEILWLTNDHTGRRAPIEKRTDPEGNVTIDVARGTWHVIVAEDGIVPIDQRHVSHFARCQFAEAYRRRCRVCQKSPCIRGPKCPVPRARKPKAEPAPTLF